MDDISEKSILRRHLAIATVLAIVYFFIASRFTGQAQDMMVMLCTLFAIIPFVITSFIIVVKTLIFLCGGAYLAAMGQLKGVKGVSNRGFLYDLRDISLNDERDGVSLVPGLWLFTMPFSVIGVYWIMTH